MPKMSFPNRPPLDLDAIRHAAALIRAGKLVAFPTETVYGLGANALDARAVRKIFEVKARPATSPLIVHVESREAVPALVSEWPAAAEKLAVEFWPGPLTLVLPKRSCIPDVVTAGLPSVGLRVPVHSRRRNRRITQRRTARARECLRPGSVGESRCPHRRAKR